MSRYGIGVWQICLLLVKRPKVYRHTVPRLNCCGGRRHTLEALSLTRPYGLWSDIILQILSSSPKLESFITLIDDDNRHLCSKMTHILTASFIDSNPSSSSLNPWACESTLGIFRVKISEILRPDITRTYTGLPIMDGMVVEETYPDQSRGIQSRVYKRLARLTRLEPLQLGCEDGTLLTPTGTFKILMRRQGWTI